jgi:hypothetical protein
VKTPFGLKKYMLFYGAKQSMGCLPLCLHYTDKPALFRGGKKNVIII